MRTGARTVKIFARGGPSVQRQRKIADFENRLKNSQEKIKR